MTACGAALVELAGEARLVAAWHAAMQRVGIAASRIAGPSISRWLAGSGQPARAISMFDPVGLAEDARGNLYFADRGSGARAGVHIGHFIWRIVPSGMAEVVAGTGIKGTPGDGQQALEADLGAPAGLAMDSTGRLHFADPYNHIVMRIEADGRLTRIAGTGEPGFSGDGGSARDAALNKPYDIDLDAAGNLYIADYANHRVRMVAPDGRIATLAGTGTPGYSGDHGPPAQAQLNGVYGVHVHQDGRLLIADSGNHVVRQVARDGTITTLAGTGEAGNSGDGGPAERARLDAPESLFVDAAGRLYVGDESNHNIRVIEPAGIITTLIGDGAPGYAMVGQPASEAPLNDPEYLLVRADGTFVISDGDTGRLLTLDDGKVAVVAGPARRSIHDAMSLFRTKDPQARTAYESRLRAAGLKE